MFTRNTVETTDTVHALKVEDDLIKDRHGSANKTGVATLRDDGKSIVN